jgi:hypothetical protein
VLLEGFGGFGGGPTGRAQTEVVCQVMRKKVIPFPPRKAAGVQPVTQGRSRIVVHIGALRYAMDITCEASVLPPETAPAATPGRLERLQVQTRFLHLSEPAGLGDRIDGWRVCWVGGWDKGKMLFVVMVERVVGAAQT